jgi:type VI secretion system secreted protein VgrG
VAVEFLEGDIDRPLIVGQLFNGQDAPPFAAGVDSDVNHPGVISGLHSHALDGAGYNQWVVDDATGQLRMRLLSGHTTAQLGLGHLIQQGPSGAQRGAWRGSGFELATDGWATVRAGKGMLISSTARQGTYGSAQGTQMDAAEALAQLKGAKNLGQRLHEAATQAGAHGLASHMAGRALEKFIQATDPKKDGKHADSVNGQSAMKPTDGRQPGAEPVEAFAQPVVLLDTPSTAAFATEGSFMAMAGQDTTLVAQGDVHQAAAHTWASVSGQTTSLYTHEGGIKAFAANGPVSIRAHTDELQVWADQDVTVISVNDEIRIQAKSRVELIGGQSSLVLQGGDITFTCPGNFEVRSAMHAFLGGGNKAANVQMLPDSRVKFFDQQVRAINELDGQPIADLPYRATTASGDVFYGRTDNNGLVDRIRTESAEGLVIEWGVVAPAA